MSDTENKEVMHAIANEYGCFCLPDQNCDQCTEYEIEYPHINDLRDESAHKLVGPALQNYNSQHFHSFISRKCR